MRRRVCRVLRIDDVRDKEIESWVEEHLGARWGTKESKPAALLALTYLPGRLVLVTEEP
jgi:hypothetical protein